MENSGFEAANKKNALYSGLALGAVLFVLGVVVYYIIIASTSIWVISMVPILISVILPIMIAILMGVDLRKKLGGYWNFKQATTALFIMFIVAYAFNTVARDLIFVKLVEPDMVQKTENAIINSTTGMMEKAGTDQNTIDTKISAIQKQFDEQKHVSIGKTIQGIGVSVILIFVVALIFGAFLKKEPPLFTVPEDEAE